MSKIALITDLHFGARNDSLILDNYFRKFYETVFFPYLEENGIKTVIDLGDTFDRRKYISYPTLARSKEYFFDPMKRLGIECHTIVGNHDIPYKNSLEANSPSLLLKEYENVTAYDIAQDITIDDLTIGILPWICPDNFQHSMGFLEDSKASIVCAHLDISGFEMHRGAISEHGFDRKMFRKFDKVLSGHFHTRSEEDNIKYLGAPYEMTWADYNDPRGFHILDTSTKEIFAVDNPYKLFMKIYYNDAGKSLDQVMSEVPDVQDSYVKVISETKTNPYWFELFCEEIEKREPFNIQIIESNLIVSENDEITVEEMEDTSTLIKRYCGQVETTLHKELEKFMLDLHMEAQDNS